jgi:hypothetical protein
MRHCALGAHVYCCHAPGLNITEHAVKRALEAEAGRPREAALEAELQQQRQEQARVAREVAAAQEAAAAAAETERTQAAAAQAAALAAARTDERTRLDDEVTAGTQRQEWLEQALLAARNARDLAVKERDATVEQSVDLDFAQRIVEDVEAEKERERMRADAAEAAVAAAKEELEKARADREVLAKEKAALANRVAAAERAVHVPFECEIEAEEGGSPLWAAREHTPAASLPHTSLQERGAQTRLPEAGAVAAAPAVTASRASEFAPRHLAGPSRRVGTRVGTRHRPPSASSK